MRSVCIFCGQRAKSVEHAWPQWLLALVTDSDAPSKTEAQFGPEGTPITCWKGPEITVRGICVRCNTGWMSNLESQAKLTLASFINDIALPLTPECQLVVSRWSIKMAMVFGLVNRRRFYAATECQDFRGLGKLPANTKIWLGRYGQSNLLCGEARYLDENRSRERNPFWDGYVTTFVVRRLVAQVLTVRRKPEFKAVQAILHSKAGPWNQCLVEIWPLTKKRIHWPPSLSFSDAGTDFTQLSGRFVTGR
jgi:hypothetical protein